MGQKVSPIGLRIGVNKTWESNWYADNKNFAKYLKNDDMIRKFLAKKLKDASVSSVLIERNDKRTEVIINTAKPGVVIGHGGDEIDKLKAELSKLVNENVQIDIDLLLKQLPNNYHETCKTEKAIQRNTNSIKSEDDLLRSVFYYVSGHTMLEAAAYIQAVTNSHMSGPGFSKKFRACGNWIKRLLSD